MKANSKHVCFFQDGNQMHLLLLCPLFTLVHHLIPGGFAAQTGCTGLHTLECSLLKVEHLLKMENKRGPNSPLEAPATPPLQWGCSVWMQPELHRWARRWPKPRCQYSPGVELDWIRSHLSCSHAEKSQMTSDFSCEQIGRSGLVKQEGRVSDLAGCPLILHFKGQSMILLNSVSVCSQFS